MSETNASEVWTVKRALDWVEGYLHSKGDEHARLSAQWLVGDVCDLSRMQLYVNLDRILSPAELSVLHVHVVRRASGEPLQYITGEASFRHITVKVAPGVLIPRPETEVLVSEALALLAPPPRPRVLDDRFIAQLAANADAVEEDDSEAYAQIKDAMLAARAVANDAGGPAELLVCDIGTGTGCIACSIAYEHAAAHVIAADVSPEALALARENVRALGLDERVDVVESDVGAGIDPALLGSIDLVVSNPPYIPTAVLGELSPEVSQFEPRLALDGGSDGLDVFRRLLEFSSIALKPGGGCAFELHETCLEEARELALRAGFADVRIVDDLAGKPRVLTAVKPSVRTA